MAANSLVMARKILDKLYIKASEEIDKNAAAIEKIHAMFCDDASKRAYAQELTYKILAPVFGNTLRANEVTGGMSLAQYYQDCERAAKDADLPAIDMDGDQQILFHSLCCTFYYEQYAYKDLVLPVSCHNRDAQTPEVMLDCGGCFGDTALWAARKGVDRIYSFEIDPANIAIMEKAIARNNAGENVHIIPKAVGSREGTLWYAPCAANAGAGKVSETKAAGSIEVPVTSIDTFCGEEGITPTFIKMDIEGAEFDALRGARNTIRAARPRLAICLYHKLEDMWKIPALIRQFVPEYKFYCKKSHPYVEFVLFATV